jgi:hypothetical protein
MEDKDPLEEEIGKYEHKWVAILESERRVAAHGDCATEAKREAEALGYPDTALFKVRSARKRYAYLS